MDSLRAKGTGLLAIAAGMAVAAYAGWTLRGSEAPEPAAPVANERREDARDTVRSETRRWWNRADIVEALGLTDAQREQIDQLFEIYRKGAAGSGSERAQSRRITDAVRRAAWDEAREALASMTESKGREESRRLEATIAILEVLSAGQRERVGERYPRLYQAGWLQAPRSRGASRAPEIDAQPTASP